MAIEKLIKNAVLKSLDVTDKDMALINGYALEPLTPEQVYTFKVVAGSNETDDRNFMPFSRKALEELAPLFVGKTMIRDHSARSENQIARVYATETRTDAEKLSGLGEPYTELVAKCYMVKTAENAGLISEIKAGIKREVSVSLAVNKFRCSICGADTCKHIPGFDYEGKTCMNIIDGCSDAYELSFVAVPAQPNAGTTKSAAEEAPDPEQQRADDFAARKAEIEKRLEESRRNFVF